MADQQKTDKERIKKMPAFTRPIVKKWIVCNLGVGLKPSEAADEFLKRFPGYNSQKYGDYQTRHNVVKKRFYEYKKDPRTSIYHEIKMFSQVNKKEIHAISVLSDPIEQILWLENLLLSGKELTVSEERKILSDILKLADKLTGEDIALAKGESNYEGVDTSDSDSDTIWEK
ncbi:hypothetical protein F4212_00900 [Candidatus Poribacteria bacterium]|nr:hypothetical protein [Candidatus Poribacteria bacterium]